MTKEKNVGEITIDDLDLRTDECMHVAINHIKKPDGWNSNKISERAFFERITNHRIGSKEGRAFLPAEVVGDKRRSKAVKAMHALVYDVDDGTPLEELVERVKSAGWMACIYTSHSHGQTRTDVPISAVSKYVRKVNRDSDPEDVCDDDVLSFLKDEKGCHTAVLDGAKVVGKAHTENGVTFSVEHAPKAKARIVIPLAQPCVIADLPNSSPQDWKALYCNVGEFLQINFDRSCADPSRAYYLPRHDKGAPFEVILLNGERANLDGFSATASKNKSTVRGKNKKHEFENPWVFDFLMKHAKEFEAEEFWEQFSDPRGECGIGGSSFECPNDDAHSNEGDPDDTGFVAMSASDSDTGKFKAWCMHEHCKDIGSFEFVDMMVTQHGLKKEDLREYLASELYLDPDELLKQNSTDDELHQQELPEPYFIDDGYICKGMGDKGVKTICGEFAIIGKARDTNGTGWSLVIEISG